MDIGSFPWLASSHRVPGVHQLHCQDAMVENMQNGSAYQSGRLSGSTNILTSLLSCPLTDFVLVAGLALPRATAGFRRSQRGCPGARLHQPAASSG